MMHPAFALILCAACLLPAAASRADTVSSEAPTDRPTSVSIETEQIVDWAREILEQVAALPPDKRAQFDALVKDAFAFAIFPRVTKQGIVLASISGRGVLVHREADGGWSLPILLSLRGTSIGPQAGATSSDVLVVFKTETALRRLGEQTHRGVDASSAARASEGEIVSYHTRRGLVLGQSIDQTSLYLDEAGNESLYGQGAKPGLIGQSLRAGLRPPPCVQKFSEQTNKLQGRPGATMQWQ